MASRRRYTRSNPDPDPFFPIGDLERILRRQRSQPVSSSSESPPQNVVRSFSLPSDLVAIQNLVFDTKFELSFIRTKYETLNRVVPEPSILELNPSLVEAVNETDVKIWRQYYKI